MQEKEWKCGDAGIGGAAVEKSASGLNDNLEFMGKPLHVQTERIGLPMPHIVTQVFSNGRVVFSRKTEIPAFGQESPESSRIQEMMHAQHFTTIQEIADKQKRILDSC
jgi:hypothetical protein